MARNPRLDLPGITQHIVQRGNNRAACFLDDHDRIHYLQLLREALAYTHCLLHAYVLMDNHVHLLITPPAAGAISRLMQKLGRQYVGQFNTKYRRTGTLWEGRYKSCLVDGDSYVLQCYRFIDLNPVRAGLAGNACEFFWSSAATHSGKFVNPNLTHHPAYLALGATAMARGHAYQALLGGHLAEDEAQAIRDHLRQQRALGSDSFKSMVAAATRHCADLRPAHRPARRG